jgi:GH25 family lysozyme M1 (1,4-beta-N-acetylmuramidase)
MAKRRKRRRRLRVGRLLLVILVAGAAVFFNVMLMRLIWNAVFSGSEPVSEPEPTPTPDPVYKNRYDWQYLSRDEHDICSYEDAEYTSSFGIDVSHYQGQIDWQAVKNAGVEFAFIRAGYRGYTEGVLHEDSWFRTNMDQAVAAGIEVGVYFFSQAVSAEEAEEEAGYLLSLIQDYPVSECVYDLEFSSEEERASANDQNINTEAARAFCRKIRESGYTPLVYGSKNFFYHDVRMVDLQDETEFWLAAYGTETPEFPYVFSMWQYSCEGQIEGIDNNVDLNIRFIKK